MPYFSKHHYIYCIFKDNAFNTEKTSPPTVVYSCRYLHPVFGPIRCLVTITKVEAGAELLTHYGYLLSHCPAWYADLWDNIAPR